MKTATSVNRHHGYFIIIFALLTLLITGNLFIAVTAEKPLPNIPGPVPQQTQDPKQSEQPKISDDAVKLFLKEIEIYGQIAKPQAVFIIPGTDPRVDGLKIDRHFFTHIFRPVEKSTLRNIRIKQESDKDHILW